MPMIPEAIVAMLACARIGAVHSVVFGGFAAKELATRIDDAEPKVVLTACCGIEPGTDRRIQAPARTRRSAYRRPSRRRSSSISGRRSRRASIPSRDHDWAAVVAAAKAGGKRAPCADLAATDPLYILYTSGTTGVPKGVVRDIGGYIVALKWTMSAIYNVNPGETYWSASDIGWVVGHSYIVYAPLLHGCTTVLYEGKPIGTPDAGAFWRVIEEYKVRAFFTAPTAFRAVRKEDPQAELLKKYDISSLHTLFLAGERADPDTVAWAEKVLDKPVVDHWWQTETGWAIAANPVGLGILPIKPGSPTVPMPGYAVDIVDEACHPVPVGTDGLDRGQAAAAARLPADPLPAGRADARKLPQGVPRLLQDRRRRDDRRGRLSHHPRPHRRHHQRRRPPPVDRRHGGGRWPRIRTSPNAPCSASRTRSRARRPAASSC